MSPDRYHTHASGGIVIVDDPVMVKLIIWAGDHNQAMRYARMQGLKRDEFLYLWEEQDLRGIRDCPIVKVGTWYMRRNIRSGFVESYAASHNITIEEIND